MLRKTIFTTIAILGLVQVAEAQYKKKLWHTYVAPTAGVMYYVGDMKANSLPDANYMHGFIGFQIAQQYKQLFTAQFSFTRGGLSGYDSLVNDQLAMRGFGFRSVTYDSELLFKLTLMNQNKRMTPASKPIIHPRLLAGFGFLYHTPKAEYNGEWIDLRALGTAGQHLGGDYPKPYSMLAFGIKLGAEINVQTGPRTGFNVFGYYTFAQTDYLDDLGSEKYISWEDIEKAPNPELLREFAYPRGRKLTTSPTNTRGNPTANDGYFNFGIALCYRITEPATSGRRRF